MNPLYLDTSALVPLVVQEPSTSLCRRIWGEAVVAVTSRLAEVELVAAVAQAGRMGRLTAAETGEALAAARFLLTALTFIEVRASITSSAADLAIAHGLRGYDATHLASALMIGSPEAAFASGDRRLLRAAGASGLTTIATV